MKFLHFFNIFFEGHLTFLNPDLSPRIQIRIESPYSDPKYWFILHILLSDLSVGVTHHGNEEVEEEKEDDEYEEEPVDAANVLVVGVAEALPHDEGVAGRHHEDHHDALHRARHRVLLQAVQEKIFLTEGYKAGVLLYEHHLLNEQKLISPRSFKCIQVG